MSLADELLASLTENESKTRTIDPNSEPHMVVNADRTVTVPEVFKKVAIQRDANIMTVPFVCPRYWYGHDLFEMNLKIVWERADGYSEPHLVENLRVDEADSTILYFEWTITNKVTAIPGKIKFSVCGKLTDADGVLEKEWHTHPNEEMYTAEGMDCSGEEVLDSNPDILNAILTRIALLEGTGKHGGAPFIEAWLSEELAKRQQLAPEFANNIGACVDPNKLYVLPDGYIYAYLLTERTEGGYTNRINTEDVHFKAGYRINASNAEVTTTTPGAFVSNRIPAVVSATQHDIIRIKGVKDGDGDSGTRPRFRLLGYNSNDAMTFAFFMTNDQTANAYVLDRAIIEDGVLTYELGLTRTADHDYDNLGTVYVRVAGVATDGIENVVVTINEELTEPTVVEEYAWTSTGHAFVPANYESRIIALETEATDIRQEITTAKKETEETIAELQEQINSGAASAKSGARWFALGDSITEGWTSAVDTSATSGYRQFINTNTAQRWVNIVADKNGYVLTNYGVGGSGYVQAVNNARAQVGSIDFSKCDFVTLAYGVNDWKYAANVGALSDIPQTIIAGYDGHNSLKLSENAPATITVYKNGTLLTVDTDYTVGGGYIHLNADSTKGDVFDVYNAVESMVSNMSYVIKKILRDNPLCKIFVITPINCKSLGTYVTNWGIDYSGDASNGLGLKDIFTLQQAVCDYHGIELIDMTHSSVINRENIRALLADSVHPTVEGHRLIARELATKINFT